MNARNPKMAAPDGDIDVWCRRWMGITVHQSTRIILLGVLAGAAMEAFMIKGWIGQTNFYETVKKKEAEKRWEKQQERNDAPSFAEVLRDQWELKKKEMEHPTSK